MKIKSLLKSFAMASLFVWTFATNAGTTTFKGASVDYGEAITNWVGGDLVLSFLSEGSLKFGDAFVKADLLLVGGGGSGSSGGSTYSKQGHGGYGGEVVKCEAVMLYGDNIIKVGRGGDSVKSSSKSARAAGNVGLNTKFIGSYNSTADAGAGGGSAGVSGEGTISDITGEAVTYGADGESRTSNKESEDGVANTGNGGSGGYGATKSGAGGSGVVIVRLTAVYDNVKLADLALGAEEEVVSFTDATSSDVVNFFYNEVKSVNFSVEGVAKAVRTKEGLLALVGLSSGETVATIEVERDESLAVYAVKISVAPVIELESHTLQRGEKFSSLVRVDTGVAIDFDYDEVKALKSSVPEIADFVRLDDGKIGIVGKRMGTVDLRIVVEGECYVCKVTVEELLSGFYRAGAYDVAVTNASEVFYVDGDLIIAYRNVDSSVGKSFVLPKPTTGRLLAVGGGGAGGQDASARNDSYGIPGGGGAGGLVISDSQPFEATEYTVMVGAGGVASRTVPNRSTSGASGTASKVISNGSTLVNAYGGGGGGARSVGAAGGSGGGGSYSGGSKNGGSSQQASPGFGSAGGKGSQRKFGAGGGGAGGPGGDTTNAIVEGSGAGGPGKLCDITGESVEYARGGAGGKPRLFTHYWIDASGEKHYVTVTTSNGKNVYTYAVKGDKIGDNDKYFWVEAEDGKPGRDGYGDGGGGGSYYSTDYGPTFAGSGGNGAVIVRIPPYETTVEDALKEAFANQMVLVSGSTVTLTDDVAGTIEIPDNLGEITLDLAGYIIAGANGIEGDDITRGGDGESALVIVSPIHSCGESGDAPTVVKVVGLGEICGGNGGDGHPQGRGAPALSGTPSSYQIGASITRTDGTDGQLISQHSHIWEYELIDNKIYANCVADDEAVCTYKERKPMLSVDAADADFTGQAYTGLTLHNTITDATGLLVSPPVYKGIQGTDYPETRTAPIGQGKYCVLFTFQNMTISDTFAIVERKAEQDSVYKSWKDALRTGNDVNIQLTATFSSDRAINDGNVLLLGSRCNAHSMATGTVEMAINAITKYANVRWYAYGSSDSENNMVNNLTRKGEKVPEKTIPLAGGNHFVYSNMMDDLYAELVEKKNISDDYDLIILEFDGDLLCRDGSSPYQLVYSLPAGWDSEKATLLHTVMKKYYDAGRVVWLVPNVNQPKDDAGYTGEYPWTSNPEFLWQRAFLNATTSTGYRNPFQKNYEDADELIKYIEDVLIGAYFQQTKITDTVKEGLEIESVTPQVRNEDGFWIDFETTDGTNFSVIESLFGVEITAKVTISGQSVEVVFDTSNVQQKALEHSKICGNDLRVSIKTKMNGFFDDVPSGEWKDTNEGYATFKFDGSKSGETFSITTTNPPPRLQNVATEPSYKADDWVGFYDGQGHTIGVTVTDPDPLKYPFEIRYSLSESGEYTSVPPVTNCCEKLPVWFEISDSAGAYLTVTNVAHITILPRVVVLKAGDASKSYDGTPLTCDTFEVNLERAAEEAMKLYGEDGENAVGFLGGDGIVSVQMTSDSVQTTVGTHANTIKPKFGS